MPKAIFFDRDGTLIDEPDTPTEAVDTWEQFKLKEDVAALSGLQPAGYMIFVITNQEAINEGNLSEAFYEATNVRFLDELKQRGVLVEKIYTCPHARSANCACRKPQRGLIDKALKEYEIDLPNSYVVGDRPSDVELGQLVGLKTVYIESPKHKLPQNLKPDFMARDLAETAEYILAADMAAKGHS